MPQITNLPYSATKSSILKFMSDFSVVEGSAHVMLFPNGKATGEVRCRLAPPPCSSVPQSSVRQPACAARLRDVTDSGEARCADLNGVGPPIVCCSARRQKFTHAVYWLRLDHVHSLEGPAF